MSGCTLCTTLRNDFSEIRTFGIWINENGKRLGLHPDLIYKLDVCADEAIMNILTHGFDESEHHEICIRLIVTDSVVSLEIKDTGKEFVPIYTSPPLEGLTIEEAPIGGLGIHLMHNLMDECRYSRHEGRNVLTLSSKITPAKNP